MGLAVATVPDLSGIYFVIGDGIGLEEGDNDTQTLDLEIMVGPNMTEVSSGDGWAILEYTGRISEPMSLSLHHNLSNEGNVTYLVGVHVKSGDLLEEDMGSIRIMPGDRHVLSYLDGELRVKVYEPTPPEDMEPSEPVYNGTYEDLPKDYRTYIGKMEWVGHVGEVEETPGFSALLSMAALTTITVLLVRSRRR
jgi:hypothetical protein